MNKLTQDLQPSFSRRVPNVRYFGSETGVCPKQSAQSLLSGKACFVCFLIII